MNFFLVVQPGLEELAERELRETCAWLRTEGLPLEIDQPQITLGEGLSFHSDTPEEALLLNKFLKIPSRLLVRVYSFEAKEFKHFEAHLQKLKLPFKIKADTFRIAASKSKLNNEKRLGLSIEKVLKLKSATQADLYFRMHQDRCTISLDSSGEHLHFRGYRQEQGSAPLRENYAAATLQYLTQDLSWSELRQKWTLIDPMAGSGTYLLEAATWSQPTQTRTYAFQKWATKTKFNLAPQKLLFNKFVGLDKDKSVLQKANNNLNHLLKAQPENSVIQSLANKMIFKHNDIFSASSSATTDEPKLNQFKKMVIVNPPFGERLSLKEGPSEFAKKTLTSIAEKWTPERIGFLFPETAGTIKPPTQDYIELFAPLRFLNNGIRVRFYTWIKN